MEPLFSDDEIVVCVKNAGILSQQGPGENMVDLLQKETGGEIYPVHRLDKDVSGVMVYAKTPKTAAELSRQIREHEMHKTYLAVVGGTVEPPSGEMEDLLYKDSRLNKAFVVDRPRRGVRRARLQYETLAVRDGRSLLRIALETGRFHQIRVQLASRGHPIVGDRRYGGERGERMMLFCHELCFLHGGSERRFSAVPDWPAWNGSFS